MVVKLDFGWKQDIGEKKKLGLGSFNITLSLVVGVEIREDMGS